MTKLAVLLVDDEEEIVDLLGEALRDEGFAVRTAPTGDAALALIQAICPDLLITDIRMPGMDGVELARRAAALCPQMRLILITGYAPPEIDLSLGRHIRLQKPVRMKRLQRAIKEVMQ